MEESDLRVQLEEHHEAAFGWALSCCDWDKATAEDVLQSSYLKALDGRAAFAGRSSFKTWLFAVIRRTAADMRRRSFVRRLLPISVAANREDTGRASPIREIVRSERNARLLAALGRLPQRQQEVLHLVFYQDLTIREAAEVMTVSIGTARTHYERGKQRLRDLLSGEQTT
jgi:RNA polymerase sigma-70 factor (ECF subfamily)